MICITRFHTPESNLAAMMAPWTRFIHSAIKPYHLGRKAPHTSLDVKIRCINRSSAIWLGVLPTTPSAYLL